MIGTIMFDILQADHIKWQFWYVQLQEEQLLKGKKEEEVSQKECKLIYFSGSSSRRRTNLTGPICEKTGPVVVSSPTERVSVFRLVLER